MAVIPTGNIFRTFTFGGENSADYSVYVTGTGVFGAPERAVEMLEIPGRNGFFAQDQGRFQNIEVVYTCSIASDDVTDFAGAISDFRNMLCSKRGYCRLTDDYNPDEYRMAVFKNAIEVDATETAQRAGAFEVTFECKPQRFLTAGETAVTMTSGGTIENPTLFDSAPMLQVNGYGNIGLGDEDIDIQNVPIGKIGLWSSRSNNANYIVEKYDGSAFNSTDKLTVKNSSVTLEFDTSPLLTISEVSQSGDFTIVGSHTTNSVTFSIETIKLAVGTSYTGTCSMTVDLGTNDYGTKRLTVNFQVINTPISGGLSRFRLRLDAENPVSGTLLDVANLDGWGWTIGTGTGYSTKSALGDPMYIDLDIGEAYKIQGNEPVSVNDAVVLPAELPTLSPGTNTITFDNTITQLKIVPRWWRV